MNSLRHRYQNDVNFKHLVDLMEATIDRCEFTGSEIREAAMLACINYEMRTLRMRTIIPSEIDNSIQAIEKYTEHSR